MSIKYLFGIATAIIVLFSCNEKTEKIVDENVFPEEKEGVNLSDTVLLDTLEGIYIGDFGGSDIRLIITHVAHNHVVGYDVYKGLRRNLLGKIKKSKDSVNLELFEPGDNEFDGVFTLNISLNSFKGEGEWVSNTGKISPKFFKFEKLDRENWEWEGDISNLTNANFTSVFYWVEDSLGSIHFESDGSCNYQYYPSTDEEERREQMKEIKGSWSKKGEKIMINWQPNNIFPTRKSTFKMSEDDGSYCLIGEGRNMCVLFF